MIEQNEELARRLGCAFVSTNMGISLKSCYDRYFKDQTPGTYWFELAQRVIEDYRNGYIGQAPMEN